MVLRTVPSVPTAQPIEAFRKWTPLSTAPVGDLLVHVAPESTLFSTTPSPTIQPVEPTKYTAFKSAAVGVWGLQVAPPSVVRSTAPAFPTATPVELVRKYTEFSETPVSVGE